VSKSQDGFALVSISDKGPGMSPEQIATIFDAFSPTADADNGEAAMDTADNAGQGSGLGLAISKAFVELHGGKITVGSKVGEGTTIAFTLPLGAASVAPRARAT
jgi:signal transduction histidine kinase